MVLVGVGSLISGAVRQIIGSSNLRWPRTKAWMRVCASLNESIDSVLAFKNKKNKKRKTGNSVLSVINFWPVEAANLKAGSTDEGNSKRMLLCFAISPRAPSLSWRTCKNNKVYICTHAECRHYRGKWKCRELLGGLVMPSSNHYYGKTCKSAPLVSALMSSVLSKHSA